MRLRPLARTGLGFATLVAASTLWVAISDRHWAATLVLGVLAIGCAYPTVTGRDPFDPRTRRRKHRRHHSKRHPAPTGAGASLSEVPADGRSDADRKA